MKEEITRIMKMVQEGKISPEDAAELIEAFNEAPDREADASGPAEPAGTAETGERAKTDDPFAKFFGAVEKIGKDVSQNVDWQGIAQQVRQGVGKGVDALKQAADEARKSGKFSVVFGMSQTKTVELPVAVPEGKTLRIEGDSGNVRVAGGAGVGSATITATFRAFDDEEARRMAEAYVPVVQESDGYVLLKQPEGTNVEADVQLTIPAGIPLEVKVGSGDVHVTATRASVRVNGGSSDVKLEGVSGSVEVSVGSGDVSVTDADASMVQVETKSGDVSLTRTTGVTTVRTASGDVTIAEGTPKTLSVEAASGDVSVDLAAPVDSTVNLRTVSGDVSVEVPDGSDCRVSLSTLRGTVSTTLELQEATQASLTLTGRLGEGAGTLDASTVNGSVRLGLRDSTA